MTLRGLLVAGGVLSVAFPAHAQEVDLDWVQATVRTLNAELEQATNRAGLKIAVPAREALAHIDSRQVFYRLQRVARRALRWGAKRRVDAPRLPERPRGEIGPLALSDIVNVTLKYVRAINARDGLTDKPRAGVLPAQTPGDLHRELDKSLVLLGALASSRKTVAAVKPTKPSGKAGGRKRGR